MVQGSTESGPIMTDLSLPPLPAATDRDRKAVRVYLLSRSEGISRHQAESILNLLARELGCTDWQTCAWTI